MESGRKTEGVGSRGSACWEGGGFKRGASRRPQEDEGASLAVLGGASAGGGTESRQDRKLWGREQRRVVDDLACSRATVTALLRSHCREPRSARQGVRVEPSWMWRLYGVDLRTGQISEIGSLKAEHLGLRWSGCSVREQGLRDSALLGLRARYEGISWPRDGSSWAVQVCRLMERLVVNSWSGRKGCGYRPGASGKEALEA